MDDKKKDSFSILLTSIKWIHITYSLHIAFVLETFFFCWKYIEKVFELLVNSFHSMWKRFCCRYIMVEGCNCRRLNIGHRHQYIGSSWQNTIRFCGSAVLLHTVIMCQMFKFNKFSLSIHNIMENGSNHERWSMRMWKFVSNSKYRRHFQFMFVRLVILEWGITQCYCYV